MKAAQMTKRMKTTQTHRFFSAFYWLDGRPVRLCFFLALVLNFGIECLSQRAVAAPLVHAITQPYLFLLGVALIFCTLSAALFVPRRYFALCLISLVWIGLAIANFVLLSYRVTPLAAIDFVLLRSVFSIIRIYLSLFQILLILAAFLMAAALLALLWRHMPIRRVQWKRAGVTMMSAVLMTVVLITLGFYSKTLPTTFGNLADAYQEYGFVYCFFTSVVDRGIDRPQQYEEQIQKLADELEVEPGQKPLEMTEHTSDLISASTPELIPPAESSAFSTEQQTSPNVIFLQLESFIDPAQMLQYAYSEEPAPTFSRLKEMYPSGYLTVPSIGAGTANTEFEIITGMSLQFFGTGEYPYKTVLRDNTCETVAYNLAERDYTTTAIHNNKATFYDRNEVFSKLGFDRFISLEYMNQVRYNAQGWACDDVLTDTILDTLRTTEQTDFIYAISVQGHGRYPDEPVEGGNGPIRVLGEEDPVMCNRVEYYVNQIAEMDAFISQLIDGLEDYDEPVILVLYGDHLPALELEEQDMQSGDLFCTEYVIWSNFDLQTEDCNLCAYQLSAHVMELLGYDNGVLTKFHQSNETESTYLQELELLEYDMLYGDRVVYDGETPYEATGLTLGLKPIWIRSVGMLGQTLYVFGENFTPYSVVRINGRQQETVFMSSYSLCVSGVDFSEIRSICVEQVSDDQEVLSETAPYLIE